MRASSEFGIFLISSTFQTVLSSRVPRLAIVYVPRRRPRRRAEDADGPLWRSAAPMDAVFVSPARSAGSAAQLHGCSATWAPHLDRAVKRQLASVLLHLASYFGIFFWEHLAWGTAALARAFLFLYHIDTLRSPLKAIPAQREPPQAHIIQLGHTKTER